ncbi:MAG: ATP-binding protein, partial [Alphaproteobacteria bacterium]|nr:ATP-binding protein [Alphaproteobacteria bacterium]
MPVVAMPNAEDLTRRLADLLSDPRETLGVELKVWLDIVDNAEHKAILAKAIIALANHGGGHVIFGFTETVDGVVAEQRPANLATYTPDTVNSIVQRYVEPPFHCDVLVVTSPETGQDHPIVAVPGGHHVPIRSKRDGPEGRGIQAS